MCIILLCAVIQLIRVYRLFYILWKIFYILSLLAEQLFSLAGQIKKVSRLSDTEQRAEGNLEFGFPDYYFSSLSTTVYKFGDVRCRHQILTTACDLSAISLSAQEEAPNIARQTPKRREERARLVNLHFTDVEAYFALQLNSNVTPSFNIFSSSRKFKCLLMI